jgi:hypothetical protein
MFPEKVPKLPCNSLQIFRICAGKFIRTKLIAGLRNIEMWSALLFMVW